MKKFISAALVLVMTTSGCSIFVPRNQSISVVCTEQDAHLQINGEMFKGSAQTSVPRNRNVSIMCTKPGYFPAQKNIDYSLSGTAVADIIGIFFFIIPGIGLFTPGAWNLDETQVTVPMLPNKS